MEIISQPVRSPGPHVRVEVAKSKVSTQTIIPIPSMETLNPIFGYFGRLQLVVLGPNTRTISRSHGFQDPHVYAIFCLLGPSVAQPEPSEERC